MSEQMLVNKVALVTGAAGGFGRVLVKAFAEQGARVCALDVDAGSLSALRSELPEALRSRVLTLVADISDYAACEQAVARAQSELGGVHILVNNAALGMGLISLEYMQQPVKILDITPDMWQRFVAVNFTGSWNMTRACITPMLAQRWGRIIDITTSLYSMLRDGFQPYGPCKAGLEAMAAAHAKEFAGSGVTVHVVIPGGPSDTPMVPHAVRLRAQGSGAARRHGIAHRVAVLAGGRWPHRQSLHRGGVGDRPGAGAGRGTLPRAHRLAAVGAASGVTGRGGDRELNRSVPIRG